MIIKEYRKYSDVDIYFLKYNWTAESVQYNKFKSGEIKCPYEKRVFRVGYVGEGDYKSRENGKITRVYVAWSHMLERCYDEKYKKKRLTYKGCTVCKEFHNFQNFGEWDSENYYEIEGEKMHLDKDILVKHNKIYSPETCIYVPQTINNLFIKSDKNRGESVIGTSYHKRNKKYQTYCNLFDIKTGKSKLKYLGYYDTQEKAFEVYKQYKEKNIKEVADYFKGLIPDKLYNALYKYEVEITD